MNGNGSHVAANSTSASSTSAFSRASPSSSTPSHPLPPGFNYSNLPPSTSGPPSIFSIPLSPKAHSASASVAVGHRPVANGHLAASANTTAAATANVAAPASSYFDNNRTAFPPLSSTPPLPAVDRAQSGDSESPAGSKSYSTALVSPSHSTGGGSSSVAQPAVSISSGQPMYQHLLRLPKRPGIKTLSPL